MKLFASLTLAAVAVVAFSTHAFAQEAESAAATAEAKPCCSKEAGAEVACQKSDCKKECSGCAVTTAMAKLPKMTYRVAGEETCCSKSAEAMAAGKEDASIEYVVGEHSFETKQAAYTSLVEQTESMVNDFVTPCKCEVSGVTKIAGTECSCPMKAGKTSEIVQAAIKDIGMTYAVGEETCSCPNKAKAMAKAAGTQATFVVNGEKTSCEMTARLNLARAKYRAAVVAMAAKDVATEAAATSGT
jgi:hypothetical protein